MRKFILIILLFTYTPMLYAQEITQKEAIQYAEKLYKVEILSELGRDSLIAFIKQGEFERWKRADLNDGSISVSNELQVSTILNFCTTTFYNELLYRVGFHLESKFHEENPFEQIENQSKKDLKKGQRAYKKFFKKNIELFEGYLIESKIKDEEDFSKEAKTFATSLSLFNVKLSGGLVHSKRSTLGKTCTRTLNDIYKIGLTREKTYNEILKGIQTEQITKEYIIFSFASERAVFYEDFEENKLKELAFIENLVARDIISPENHKKLINSYQPFELKEKYDFLPYCNQALIFDLSKYDINPTIGYAQIFEEIKRLIPGFDYQNFDFELIENKDFYDNELIEQRATIQFEVNGTKYINNFFYDYKRKKPRDGDIIPVLKISQNFHKGINKYLADINSPLRLYYAHKKGKYAIYEEYEKEFTLILLTREQYEAWGESMYFLFKQSHDNSFNTQSIQKHIQTYEKLGLFVHLSPEEIAKGKQTVLEKEIDEYVDILCCFPKMVVYFDWETGNLTNPYEELTQEFSASSRGAFTPTKIRDNFEKNWESKFTPYSFELEGKTYARQLHMQSDWLDPAFLELIEQALEENQVDGKIYYCLDNGQASGYIFFNNQQYQFLKENQSELFPEF